MKKVLLNFYIVLMVLVTVLLLTSLSDAQELAYGAKTKDEPGFVVRDFSDFSLIHKDMFGLERYGFGSGQLELSEKPQVVATNRSGILLGSGLYRMGIEPFSGMLSYQNRPDYEWTPSMSLGLKFNLGIAALYAGPRAGLSYRKYYNEPLTGGVIGAQVLFLTVNYYVNEYYKTKDRLEIIDVNIGNRMNVQRQTTTDKGDVYIIGIRGEL